MSLRGPVPTPTTEARRAEFIILITEEISAFYSEESVEGNTILIS